MTRPAVSSRGMARSALALVVTASLALSPFTAGRVHAEGGSVTDLNGSDPRPFYVFAHNPNTVHDAEVALQAGANALEPDVTVAEPDTDNPSCGSGVLVDWDSSFPNRDGLCSDTKFVDWLKGVHDLAIQYPGLALIVFDIKTSAATPDHGKEIRDAVRTYLNVDPVKLNVIFSVAKLDDAKKGVFDEILSDLRPNEGVQIDAEDDPAAVVQFFFDRNYSGNIAYGDGTAFQGPNLPRAIDRAAFLRASVGYPKAVTYVYTLNHVTSMHSFIDSGVDGIIPDEFGFQASGDPSYITELLNVVQEHPEIRIATRDDNPFRPALQSYGLEVQTSDNLFAGTDANLSFTLVGCRGAATITVDTGEVLNPIYDSDRMQRGNRDSMAIPSKNLGRLSQVVIFNDGTGDAPGWDFDFINVSSAGWLGPNFGHAREYQAGGASLDGGHTVVLGLTPNFPEPPPTIQCPAPITVPNAPGQCSAAVTYSPAVDGMCFDVKAVSTPPSGTVFPVGTSTVSAYAQEDTDGPRSDACQFTVTVQDTENPAITCPAPMVVGATSPQGAAVSFAPSATDNCSVATLTSSPPSGSVFPIGTTTVNNEATDPSGNQSSCSFTVHVKGAAEQITDLIALVKSFNLRAGDANALLPKLQEALVDLSKGKTKEACNELQAFINEVNGQKKDRNRQLGQHPEEAVQLIVAATQIRAVLGC